MSETIEMVQVRMLKEHTERLDALRKKTWPANWTGRVNRDIADKMLLAGAAIAVGVAAEPVTLTPDETAVLKAAAGEILKQGQAATVDAAPPVAAKPHARKSRK